MVLHAAAMMAFFVDAGQQAQCAVQCVPIAGQDPLWARLLFAAIPSIFALGIAALVFYWSGRRERKQWIRDQKKAEWSRLLEGFANIYRIVHLGKTMNREIAEGLKNELKPAIRALSVALANCISLEEFRPNSQKGKKVTEFIKSANITSDRISMWLELFDSTIEKEILSEEDRQGLLENVDSIANEVFKFAGESSDLLLWLQEEAAKDLMF
jgi:hypothetical protein